jgi:hypothetical protein
LVRKKAKGKRKKGVENTMNHTRPSDKFPLSNWATSLDSPLFAMVYLPNEPKVDEASSFVVVSTKQSQSTDNASHSERSEESLFTKQTQN